MFCSTFHQGSGQAAALQRAGRLERQPDEPVMVTNETYINAASVYDFLRLITALKLAVPITLSLGNARFQKCDLVRDLARPFGVKLFYFRDFSSHHNLIKRLWKLVKTKCLYPICHKEFTVFKQAISSC